MMARGKGRNHPAASRARSREPYRREEHLAKSIRLLSEGDDYVAWAGEVANYATTLNQLAEVLTALRKVARDSEILIEREEKA